MNKQEYLNHVKELMKDCDEQFVSDILRDFEEHFEQGIKDGKSEFEIAESLGDIGEWIEEIKSEYTKKQLPAAADQTESNEIRKVVVKADALDVKIEGDAERISWRLEDDWAKMNVHNYQVVETVAKGRLILEVTPKEHSRFGIVYSHVHFVLSIPSNLEEVRIETGSGDIDVEEADAEIFKLLARSGDVTIEEVQGNLWVKTQSGDIQVNDCESKQIVLNSTSGDIDVTCDESEELSIRSTSGEIEVEAEEVEKVSLNSTSGDIEFEGTVKHLKISSTSGDVEVCASGIEAMMVETTSGDVQVKVEECSGMQGITETRSGDVRVKFEGVQYSAGSGFSWGDGSTQVVIKTSSGDISLHE